MPTFCKDRISAPSAAAAAGGSSLPLIEPDSETRHRHRRDARVEGRGLLGFDLDPGDDRGGPPRPCEDHVVRPLCRIERRQDELPARVGLGGLHHYPILLRADSDLGQAGLHVARDRSQSHRHHADDGLQAKRTVAAPDNRLAGIEIDDETGRLAGLNGESVNQLQPALLGARCSYRCHRTFGRHHIVGRGAGTVRTQHQAHLRVLPRRQGSLPEIDQEPVLQGQQIHLAGRADRDVGPAAIVVVGTHALMHAYPFNCDDNGVEPARRCVGQRDSQGARATEAAAAVAAPRSAAASGRPASGPPLPPVPLPAPPPAGAVLACDMPSPPPPPQAASVMRPVMAKSPAQKFRSEIRHGGPPIYGPSLSQEWEFFPFSNRPVACFCGSPDACRRAFDRPMGPRGAAAVGAAARSPRARATLEAARSGAPSPVRECRAGSTRKLGSSGRRCNAPVVRQCSPTRTSSAQGEQAARARRSCSVGTGNCAGSSPG